MQFTLGLNWKQCRFWIKLFVPFKYRRKFHIENPRILKPEIRLRWSKFRYFKTFFKVRGSPVKKYVLRSCSLLFLSETIVHIWNSERAIVLNRYIIEFHSLGQNWNSDFLYIFAWYYAKSLSLSIDLILYMSYRAMGYVQTYEMFILWIMSKI